jgi:hypothetical protein
MLWVIRNEKECRIRDIITELLEVDKCKANG